MLTKQEIQHIKTNDSQQLYQALQKCEDDKELIFILSNLGRLPSHFDGRLFVSYLAHPNAQIRFWAVKNLGKLKNHHYFSSLSNVVYCETDSMVKREAVSAIGRIQTEKAIPLLLALLNNSDPKIVVQAIRALLVFKHDQTVLEHLELCQRIIRFYSYKGDLVFDPFGGSGTLGKAAMNLGRYFFMTEQQKKYIELDVQSFWPLKRKKSSKNLTKRREKEMF